MAINLVPCEKEAFSKGEPVKRIGQITLATCLAFAALITASAPAQADESVMVNGVACTIVGTSGNDTLTGTDGNDVICGLGGDDIIQGGPGADKLFAGDGTDSLLGGDGSDLLDGGTGDDTSNGEAGNDVINDGLGDDISEGGPGADKLFGGDGADALLGNDGGDYLDGGAGSDTLDGGGGVDYCAIQPADTTKSCFYDSKAPTLVSVSVSPKAIDTGTGPQEVKIRMRIKDIGAGISGYCQTGETMNAAGIPCSSWRIYVRFTNGELEVVFGLDSRKCTATGFVPPITEDNIERVEKVGSICRISGTANDGVYEGITQVSSTKRGMYRLDSVDMWDDAGNRRDIRSEELAARKLNIAFKQTFLGDASKPVLVSAAFPIATVDSSTSDATAKIRLRIKDSGSGVCKPTCVNGRLVAQLVSKGDSPIQIPIQSFTRISGTANNGVYEGLAYFRQGTQAGKFYLDDVDFSDMSNNITRLFSADLAEKKLLINVKQTGAGDGEKPVIQNVQLSTTSVVTGSEKQEITVDFRVVDNRGVFLPPSANKEIMPSSRISGAFISDDGKRMISFAIGSLDTDCTKVSGESQVGCRLSGDATNGVYRTKIVVPQNSARGAYTLQYIWVSDEAANLLKHETVEAVAGAGIATSFTVQ
jgi:hypothetical protein